MKLVPELLCSDLEATRAFYTSTFGFDVRYERPQEKFARFTLNGSDLMCEEVSGPGRRWITGELRYPFGRGINLQWEVVDVAALFDRVVRTQPAAVYLELECREYRCPDRVVRQTQFIAQDPDGYLFRFCSS